MRHLLGGYYSEGGELCLPGGDEVGRGGQSGRDGARQDTGSGEGHHGYSLFSMAVLSGKVRPASEFE